jgi:Rod binding domain-containing protein
MSNISSIMPNLPLPAPKPDEAEAPKAASKTERDPEHEKLWKATHDFEAYFVGMLLKKMHSSAAKGGGGEEKSETGTYREMFDDAVAAQIGKRGDFGIADTLYKRLVLQLDGPPNLAEIEKKMAGANQAKTDIKPEVKAEAKKDNGGI